MCLGHKWIPANGELFFLNVGLNMKRCSLINMQFSNIWKVTLNTIAQYNISRNKPHSKTLTVERKQFI